MLSYKRNFPKQGHELTADMTYNTSKSSSSNLIKSDSLDFTTKNVMKTSSQRQDGIGANENYVFQTDYSNPLNEKSKIDIGGRVSIRKVDNKNDFYFISPSGTATYIAEDPD